jgi:hypothetical protein
VQIGVGPSTLKNSLGAVGVRSRRIAAVQDRDRECRKWAGKPAFPLGIIPLTQVRAIGMPSARDRPGDDLAIEKGLSRLRPRPYFDGSRLQLGRNPNPADLSTARLHIRSAALLGR